MFRFFRKIRQDQMAKGKIGHYLKYAVGEIVLVVLGILIALQINNWNQKQQLKKEELQTLKSLQEAISINSTEFDSIFKAQLQRNQSLQYVLFRDLSRLDLPQLDSLITKNVDNHTFDPSTGIYNSIINSGKIELISNDNLKNRISRLLDRVSDYQESEDEVTDYTKQHLETSFIEKFTINPLVLAGISERTPEEKVKDKAFFIENFSRQKAKNMYILLLNKMNVIILKGSELQKEYAGLINDLEAEIKDKN